MHVDVRLSGFHHLLFVARLDVEYVRCTLLAHPGLLLHADLPQEDYLHLSVLLFGKVGVGSQALLQEFAILTRRLDVGDPEAVPDEVLVLPEKA
jgi:hypothetical protein